MTVYGITKSNWILTDKDYCGFTYSNKAINGFPKFVQLAQD